MKLEINLDSGLAAKRVSGVTNCQYCIHSQNRMERTKPKNQGADSGEPAPLAKRIRDRGQLRTTLGQFKWLKKLKLHGYKPRDALILPGLLAVACDPVMMKLYGRIFGKSTDT